MWKHEINTSIGGKVFRGKEPAAARSGVVALLVSAILVVGLIAWEERAEAARAREVLGLTRGAIVDRTGQALAYTTQSGTAVERHYLLPDASHAVGYRDAAGRWHGIEGLYNGLLGASAAAHNWQSFFLHLGGASTRGGSVQLTIDRRVQRAAASALGNAPGAVVALQPSTGDVLALVSSPHCSPALLSTRTGFRRCRSAANQPVQNKAVGLTVAPGSAFKIVTLSAALDTGAFHLGDIFSGADAFGPSPYFNNTEYPSNITRTDLTAITLEQALAFSDNFSFAHIGLTVGGKTLLRYARRFLVGLRIPFVYPVARSRIADGSSHPTPGQVARSAFGAPDDLVTPMQMALIASAVANGGVLMAPRLVLSVRNPDSRVVSSTRPRILGRVMTPAAARAVATAMVFVVNYGSGFNAQIHGMAVAGKTGTAASGRDKPHAWFICFAPAAHPVVAVAVLREFSGEGFQYAAPIARRVLIAALQARGFHVR